MRRVSKVNAMVAQMVKASAYKVEDPGSIPGREDPLETFFASTRDECLSPRVRLECNPEIPVAPGEEH